MSRCKLHPRYKGILTPRSMHPECTCWEVYAEMRANVASYDEEHDHHYRDIR